MDSLVHYSYLAMQMQYIVYRLTRSNLRNLFGYANVKQMSHLTYCCKLVYENRINSN